MTSKLITIGTDVAALLLFHPDDLAHRHDHPIAWYTYDFAYGVDAAEGRLIAFFTGSDGGYAVRLTTEGLSPRERQWSVASWTFRYRVHHGRVLLDNSDALPGEERMIDAAAFPDSWFELANGDYTATVHAIAWHEEPDAVDANGRQHPDSLPNYVVAFEAVDDLTTVASSATPPDLRAVRGRTPKASLSTWSERIYLQSDDEPLDARYPVLVTLESRVSTGFHASIPAPARFQGVDLGDCDAWLPGLTRSMRMLAVAPEATARGLALMARITGASQVGNELPHLSVVGGRLVRLGDVIEEDGWPRAAVVPVARSDSVVTTAELDRVKAEIAAAADASADFRTRLKSPSFELARMRTITSAEALTGWLLHFLDLPQAQRIDLLSRSDADRVKALRTLLPI